MSGHFLKHVLSSHHLDYNLPQASVSSACESLPLATSLVFLVGQEATAKLFFLPGYPCLDIRPTVTITCRNLAQVREQLGACAMRAHPLSEEARSRLASLGA